MNKICIFIAAVIILTACHSTSKYDAEGNFESSEITISAESTGKILSLEIREGQVISKDQTIGYIDSVQLYLNKLQLEQSMISILRNRPDLDKQVSSTEAQIKKQKLERERLINLLNDGAATTKQLDDVNAQIEILENQLIAQKSSIENSSSSLNAQSSSIEMQIAQIDDKLAKCVITSPTEGTVLAKYAEAGEFTSTGKPIFKIADLQNVYLRTYLTSAQLTNLQLGQKVKVYADFGGDNIHEYDGVIEWISSKSEFTPKNIQTDDERANLVYAVKVAVKNDGYIKLGMYGGINF